MAKNKKQKGNFKKKLTNKFSLVVLNEDTFEERFSLKLSRLNVFVFGGFFSVLLMILTIVLIAFTPIKEYIPGYSSTLLKTNALNATLKADSLKIQLSILENYTKALRPVLTGELKTETIDSLLLEQERRIINENELDATKADSLFRESVDRRDRFPIINNIQSNVDLVFFCPFKRSNFSNLRPQYQTFCSRYSSKYGGTRKSNCRRYGYFFRMDNRNRLCAYFKTQQ